MDFRKNYFELFELPVDFNINRDQLAARYLSLQKAVHPDRHAGGTDQEKRLSMQETTQVNRAHETLKSPLKRAIYMLELAGVRIAENPVLPPEFLMEQIELREKLEDIDENASVEKLDAFSREVSERMANIERQFAGAVSDDLARAEECVYELQFLNKLLIEATRLEEKLLDY